MGVSILALSSYRMTLTKNRGAEFATVILVACFPTFPKFYKFLKNGRNEKSRSSGGRTKDNREEANRDVHRLREL